MYKPPIDNPAPAASPELLHTRRITALVGNYGSGKTELALNLALAIKAHTDKPVMLVDLDIVNPYFRSAEQRELLERNGIEVEQPSFALTAVDVPALPASIQQIFERPELQVVIDVGGNDVGAAALGRYKPYFDREGCELLYVVNAFRPLSATVEDARNMIELIAARARLTVDGIINNSNLQDETALADVLSGQAMLDEVSRELDIPVRAVSVLTRLMDELPAELRAKAFPVARLMVPEWL